MRTLLLHGRVEGLLHISKRHKEHALYKIGFQLADQIDVCVFQHHGDGRSLVAPQPEFAADALDQAVCRRCRKHPFLEYLLAQTFAAGAYQHDCAALFHCVLGVIQRLLCLIQVQILGRAALRNDHHIRSFRNRDRVQLVQERAAFAVRLRHIARACVDDLLVLVQHHVQDEVHTHHGRGFLDVLTHGIAFELARARGRLHHAAVVRLNCRARGNAGHDGLRAAGIACKIMIFNIAQADSAVGFRNRAHDIHRRAAAGLPDMYAI